MKVLIIDNYDSFTYNLYQMVGRLLEAAGRPFTVDVLRNNELSVADVAAGGYDRVIISPGPGAPDDPAYFGVCGDVISQVGKTVPVLGVCLGMQGIAHVFGGKVVRAGVPMHGKTSLLEHGGAGLFAGLPQSIEVMRYHSLVVEPDSLPPDLEITARTTDGDRAIMGLRHRRYPVSGIQFHPESFATEGGEVMLRNFLEGA